MSRVIVVYRDAGTGRFVSRAYAEAHPETTIAHHYKAQEGNDDAA